MHPTPARIEETAEWFGFGDLDPQSARILLSGGDRLRANALSHCQQAVEKWLKAFLVWHGIAFPKIQDLRKIGALCVAVDPQLQACVVSVADLTDFGTIYRYPGTELVMDLAGAKNWIAVTTQARVSILAKFPAELLRVVSEN